MIIEDLIAQRRITDPDDFNGEIIDDNHFLAMLEAANWAPTHGYTEPWRFLVFTPEKVKTFGALHAQVYKENTSSEQFLQKKYDKLFHRADKASHVVVVVMEYGSKSNILEIEEICAVACSVQNMLLVAANYNIASFWGTGGMCFHPMMAKNLMLTENQKILGFLIFGKTDNVLKSGTRNSPITSKTTYF
jgi:nitroreductase